MNIQSSEIIRVSRVGEFKYSCFSKPKRQKCSKLGMRARELVLLPLAHDIWYFSVRYSNNQPSLAYNDYKIIVPNLPSQR